MNLEAIIDKVLNEVSGKKAWEWVARISQYDRVQASPGYNKIAKRLAKHLQDLGFTDIEVFESPADGKTKTWEWSPSYRWDINQGTLKITSPEEEEICNYEKMNLCVVTHSQSCDVESEVIDIGPGTSPENYENKDIEGKIVLTSEPIIKNFHLIEKFGAQGVITYPNIERNHGDIEICLYNWLMPSKGEYNSLKFGFSLSYKQAQKLKKHLENGKLKVHAKIDATLSDGFYRVFSVPIYGSEFPEEEIVIIAHLCHPLPSANDNASGVASVLELARSLKALIEQKVLEPPKRTIRFVWVPEFNGTIPWVKKHEEKIKKSIACINLDMVGEHRKKVGYPFFIFGAPYSTPSIINDLSRIIIKKIAENKKSIAINGTKTPMAYKIKPFDGGSDHVIFSDSHFKIPSLMLNHDDPYYHSSKDTVEMCDPTELKRVIGFTGVLSYLLSVINKNWLNILYTKIHSSSYIRYKKLANLTDRIIHNLSNIHDKDKEVDINHKIRLGFSLIFSAIKYERDIIFSTKKFLSYSRLPPLYDLWLKENENFGQTQLNLFKEKLNEISFGGEIDGEKDKLLETKYQLNINGPIPFKKMLRLGNKQKFKEFTEKLSYEFLGPIYELINLIAKNNNVLEICSYLTIEYETIITPKTIIDLLRILEKEEIIKKLN
jgi:aminopeptidase-like protein